MLNFYCIHCGQPIETDPQMAGTLCGCPACGATIEVPLPVQSTAPTMVPSSMSPARSEAPPYTGASPQTEVLPVSTPVTVPSTPPSSLPPEVPPPPPLWTTNPDMSGAGVSQVKINRGPVPEPGFVGLATIAVLLTSVIAVLIGLPQRGGAGASMSNISMLIGGVLGGFVMIVACSMVAASILGAILMLFRVSFKTTLRRTYSYVALVLCVCSLIGMANNRRLANQQAAKEMRSTVAGLQDDLNQMFQSSTGPDGLPTKMKLEFEPESKSTAPGNTGASIASSPASGAVEDMKKLREVTQSLMTDLAQIQNDYIEALDKAGISVLLSAERVAKDEGFDESQKMLEEIKAAVQASRDKASTFLKQGPDRLKKYQFSSQSEAEMIAGFKKGMAKSTPGFNEIWDLEVKSVELMEDLLNHLHTTRLFWEADAQGQFVFARDSDLEQFNDIFDQITSCVARQDEIRKAALSDVNQQLGTLKDRLPE